MTGCGGQQDRAGRKPKSGQYRGHGAALGAFSNSFQREKLWGLVSGRIAQGALLRVPAVVPQLVLRSRITAPRPWEPIVARPAHGKEQRLWR